MGIEDFLIVYQIREEEIINDECKWIYTLVYPTFTKDTFEKFGDFKARVLKGDKANEYESNSGLTNEEFLKKMELKEEYDLEYINKHFEFIEI